MNPFSNENLAPIFLLIQEGSDRIKSRENSTLEFKESFNWGSKSDYAKTMAAFANAKGGYIVFGVTNKPRRLKGLENNRFEDLDPAKVTEFLNEYFSPEIEWEMALHEYIGKKFGIFFIQEASQKPILCRKNSEDKIRESCIYYRYRGRSENIKYPELRTLLEYQRKKDQELILAHLNKVSEIGINNVGILDTKNGKIDGPGGIVYIDENILHKINFIKEGHFKEDNAKPAYKIIGKVEAINSSLIRPIKKLVRTKPIRTNDIVIDFLAQEEVTDPLEYIKQVCFETTANLPIYYFLRLSKNTKDKTIEIVKEINCRNTSKNRLIKRLSSLEDFSYGVPNSVTKKYQKIKDMKDFILTKKFSISDDLEQIKFFLDAVRTLKKNEIDYEYLGPLLIKIYNQFYANKNPDISDNIRKSICYVDHILFGLV